MSLLFLLASLMSRHTTPLQTSRCAGCSRVITERTRRPCPECGSVNRHVSITASDRVAISDRIA